jgi:hypothetical protein
MQIQLSFENIPTPKTAVWDQLDDEQKAVVIESLARLIAKMILAEKPSGAEHDR